MRVAAMMKGSSSLVGLGADSMLTRSLRITAWLTCSESCGHGLQTIVSRDCRILT